jgi:tRNA(fMet)-specific endonuclease VapC
MNGNSAAALDTNQAIQVLNDVPAVVSWLATFERICLPVTVVGELLFGALNSSRAEDNLAKVLALATRCEVWPTTVQTSTAYAELRLELKKAGQPIPENDLWIAAACVEQDVPLITDDGHFDAIRRLRRLRQPGP